MCVAPIPDDTWLQRSRCWSEVGSFTSNQDFLLLRAGTSVPVPEFILHVNKPEKQDGIIAQGKQKWYGSTRISMRIIPVQTVLRA